MFFTGVYALLFYIIGAKFEEENIDYDNPSDLFYNSFKMQPEREPILKLMII